MTVALACGLPAGKCGRRLPARLFIVVRKEDDRQRYRVEWSFAWLGNFRRLLIRWERLIVAYRGFFGLALALICICRLVGGGCA